VHFSPPHYPMMLKYEQGTRRPSTLERLRRPLPFTPKARGGEEKRISKSRVHNPVAMGFRAENPCVWAVFVRSGKGVV
jgi:hypothetical protein